MGSQSDKREHTPVAPSPGSEGVVFLSDREFRIGIFYRVGQGPAVTHCREGGRGHRLT